MRVVSLADDVTLELQVFFRHDAGSTTGTSESSPAASPAA
jgi:hypothetical protein